MNQPHTSTIVHTSYWDFFQHYYSPQLKKIDLLIKTMDRVLSVEEASRALHLNENLIKKIMAEKNISIIDKEGLLSILMHGDSPLCGLLQREFMRGSPSMYSPEDISYVYGLQKEHVESVFQNSGFNERVSAETLPQVLDKVFVFIMK